MKYRVGMELYDAYVEPNGQCVMSTHIVRTIRGGFVYAVEKIEHITWVRKSNHAGDIGWANTIDRLYRSKVKEGEKFPRLHTTKMAAWRDVLNNGLKYTDDPNKAEATIKRNISKLRKNVTK